jgi:hypothetical protein
MTRVILHLTMTLGLISVPVSAQTSSDAQCSASATQATGYTPGQATSSGPDGDRLAGAARGAAAGAVVGEAQGNSYDRAPEGLQQQHREDQAKTGAAAGMAVAGSRNRQERRSERSSAADLQVAWQSSYDACIASK